ncbi:MAG: patatin-like phospholipase family protein [Bacteroidales bacterium]|jgi:NTE family protein
MEKTVSLVLSSGGARGVAHIGVIEELERQGFKINSIAGSSMGALVGGVYASGNLQVFREWMCDLDKKTVFNLVDFALSTNGLVKGNKVIKELKKIIPDLNIEDLPLNFTAVATDIKNKKEVLFETGSLYEAIRASISIPTVFKPCMVEGMVLIDGGVLNPLPINRIKRNNNDLLIAVDVNSPVLFEKYVAVKKTSTKEIELNYFTFLMNKGFSFLPKISDMQLNYFTLLSQTASLMIQQISALTIEIQQPDILIKIPMNSYGPFHFYKSEEIIKAGELATRKALEEFHR